MVLSISQLCHRKHFNVILFLAMHHNQPLKITRPLDTKLLKVADPNLQLITALKSRSTYGDTCKSP